jgi:rare lipoprotein A
VAAIVIATSVAALGLNSSGPTRLDAAKTGSLPAASVTTGTGGPREPERADRGEARIGPAPATASSAPPSTAPARSTTTAPSPTPRPRQTQPPGDGTVTGTGTCQASYYDTGTRTANGERFDTNAFTAAHRSLPFNTRVRVTNTANGRSVVVRINDRGPFVSGRCLDLTRAGFTAIASISNGVASVRYEVLG